MRSFKDGTDRSLALQEVSVDVAKGQQPYRLKATMPPNAETGSASTASL